MVNALDAVSAKWIISLVILSYAVFHLFKRQLRILWLMLRLPGPFPYPIIGNAHWAVDHKRLYEASKVCRQLYGPIIRVWITVFPMIVIIEPDDIQKVLASSKHVGKIYFYKLLDSFLGEGLVTLGVSKWRTHRRLLQPSFHVSFIEEYVQVFDKGSQILIDALEDHIQKNSIYVNVTPFVNKCVVNILKEVILGIPTDPKTAFKVDSSPLRQGTIKFQYRVVRPWLLFNSIYKLTELAKNEIDHKNSFVSYTRKVIKERQKLHETGSLQNRCFLDSLIEIAKTNPNFTEEDCIQEARTFMLAGQDSVGAALAFCLHEIANNADVQEKVVEELDSIFGTSQRPITPYDLRDMRYLEQCVKETLRLYPSVPLIGRTLGEDVKLGKYTLPEGCNVFLAPYATHRLPDHFPDPEVFNPDRFEPDKNEERHPYAYFPFSAGPRNCIGNKFAVIEMKTLVANILRKYHLSPVPGKEKLDMRYRITLRASGGIWATFTPRRNEIAKQVDGRDL